MTADFDIFVPRRHSGSYKWDSEPEDDVLPLWVADMDFPTAPCIIEALRRRVEHGIFGYTRVGEEYYNATVDWFARRHGWTINPSHIIYTSGVVPAISAIIKAMTAPGDKVVVLTPVYNCFFSSIRNNGCEPSCSRLVYSPDGYTVDFEDLERRCADPAARMMIVCNPHNPAGRVWTRAELTRMAEIARRHGLFVISDEIHCELTFEGHDYTPWGCLGEEFKAMSAICVSPSKAFNIAGLQIASIVATDAEVRRRIDRAININEVCDVNPFGVVATVAAYTAGEPWLNDLRRYLWDNYVLLRDYFRKNHPDYPVTPLEGTYLAWVNCSASGMDADSLEQLLLDRARVHLNSGSMYGPGGENFLRVNLATPRHILAEALRRISPYLPTR